MRLPNNNWREVALSAGTQKQVAKTFGVAQATVSKYRKKIWSEFLDLPTHEERVRALTEFTLKIRGLWTS